jgi:zinc transport system substrate-binding protein
LIIIISCDKPQQFAFWGSSGSGGIKLKIRGQLNMKRVLLFILFAVLLIAIPGCDNAELQPAEEITTLSVVTTIFPLADMAEKLGGDKVNVSYLLPPGASPHTFEPTVEQARLVSEADLFVYVGAGLDDWAARLAESAGPGLMLLNLSDSVSLLQAVSYKDLEHSEELKDNHGQDDHAHEEEPLAADASHNEDDHDHGPEDPHFWLDPVTVRDVITPAITGALLLLAPDDKAYFNEMAEGYRHELNLLHEEIESKLSAVKNRRFIAFHSAWQYFAYRYSLEEIAVIALFPGQEPSAGWMAELIELVDKNSITAIFSEAQFPPELAERIAEESGLNLLELDPLGGPAMEGRESYLGLMRYNLNMFLEGFSK